MAVTAPLSSLRKLDSAACLAINPSHFLRCSATRTWRTTRSLYSAKREPRFACHPNDNSPNKLSHRMEGRRLRDQGQDKIHSTLRVIPSLQPSVPPRDKPLAASHQVIDPGQSGYPTCASRHPVSGFPPASPVGVCRFHSAVVP